MPLDRTAFNALIDDDGSGLTGSVVNKAMLEAVLLDPMDAQLEGLRSDRFFADDYAQGNDTTDDTIGLNDLVADVTANGGGVVILRPRAVYKITDEIDWGPLSNVRIIGNGATIKPYFTSGTKHCFKFDAYSVIADTNPTGNVNGGFAGRHLNVASGYTLSSATGFAQDQYLLQFFNDGASHGVDEKTHAQITKLKTLAGAVVTTEDLVKVPLSSSQSGGDAIRAITLGSNVHIEGLKFDGSQSTGGHYNAIFLSGYRNSTLIDIDVENMLDGGIYAQFGYRNRYVRIRGYKSGDLVSGGYSSFWFYYQTACVFDDVDAQRCAFGFSLLYSTDCRIINPRSEGGVGRGIKLYGTAYCSLVNPYACYNGADGISIWCSYHMQIVNAVVLGNVGASALGGLQITTLANKRISILGLKAFGNLATSTGVDFYVGSDGADGDENHYFDGIDCGTPFFGENSPNGLAIKIRMADGHGQATAVAGAVTLHRQEGTITTESLTTAAGSLYTLTLTNNFVRIFDRCNVYVTVRSGTNTGGLPVVAPVGISSHTANIVIKNDGSTPFNGTLKIGFEVK